MSKTEFNEDQFNSIYPLGIERHYWTLARNIIIKKELNKYGLSSKKILEIGCGRGIVVNFLRQANLNCYGVDLAKVSPTSGVAPYIYSGIDFTALPKDFKDSVEVVLLLDVIEHLSEPGSFLHLVKENFPKAKYMMVTVPGRAELWSNYDTFNGHYRRYSIETLTESLELGGWRSKEIRYLFHVLYFPARFLVKITGKRETKINSPLGISIYFHKLLAWLLVTDYLLLPKKFKGSSVMSMATAN